VNIKILLFNNRIYGLTKGQYSPTSEAGKVTKSTPMGSIDYPFNPISVALGAEASFVARTIDSDRKHLTEVLRAAAAHEGSALVEIYQNCNIFNDGAWEPLKDPKVRDDNLMRLEHGRPVRFGPDGAMGLGRGADGVLTVVDVARFGEDRLWIHDAQAAEPSTAFAIARLADFNTLEHTAIGIFRDVQRPVYDHLLAAQQEHATAQGRGDLGRLMAGRDTWTIGPRRTAEDQG
jgi:2-oxoglutarate ferredoxin oxidoreductase subunit beta